MLYKRLLTIVALLLILPIFWLCCGVLLPAQYAESYLAGMSVKLDRLEEKTEKPRIVLVGGSAVAFGVDSALMEAQLPEYSVVNFGLYAGLGMPMMLELAKSQLREGDIVIVMPEQQQQSLSDYFHAEAVWQAADGRFDWILRLDKRHWPALTCAFPAFSMQKLRYVLEGASPADDPVYCCASFDRRGDLRNDRIAANTMPGGFDGGMPISLTADALPDEAFVQILNEFQKQAQRKRASVYYAFCPMNRAALTAGSRADAYYDLLDACLDFPILGNPNESVMDAGWFFDTNFHLNESGRIVFTRMLTRAIKAELGNSSKTVIDLPEMPAMAEATAIQGDNRDADCFIWEIRGGQAILTGVKPEARDRASLLLPTMVQGAPVRALADGLFAGCEKLKTVTLQWKSPGDCTPGQELLRDAPKALSIIAPKDVAKTYRISYFWSPFAERIAEGE